jgi:hypothetical protein
VRLLSVLLADIFCPWNYVYPRVLTKEMSFVVKAFSTGKIRNESVLVSGPVVEKLCSRQLALARVAVTRNTCRNMAGKPLKKRSLFIP